MPTLVVDANPILAALLGGRARDIFFHPDFRFLTTEHTVQEVQKYLPVIADKSGISIQKLRGVLALLPLEVVARRQYQDRTAKAKKLLADIDPDDAEILALAMAKGLPLWSNDRHFEQIAAPIHLVKTRELF